MADPLPCSSTACDQLAVEVLVLRGQPGHVHDCARCAAGVREWCDVVRSLPIRDGVCPIASCTPDPIYTAAPTPLAPRP